MVGGIFTTLTAGKRFKNASGVVVRVRSQSSRREEMKKCDRKCVSELVAKAKRITPGADFWIPGGTTNMWNEKTNTRYLGWPNLKFKHPVLKKDGTPMKGKYITEFFAMNFCPVCGGQL
jgi:hypothetical protein